MQSDIVTIYELKLVRNAQFGLTLNCKINSTYIYALTPFGEHTEEDSEASYENDVDEEDEILLRVFA